LFDTAIVDGLSSFQQLQVIVLPRLGTIAAVLGSLLFLSLWTDSFLVSETVMAKNAVVEGVMVTPALFEQLFLGCLPALGVLVLLSLRQFARLFAAAALQR
jgi:ABC-type glycerol-3-phosphate transport system permease component